MDNHQYSFTRKSFLACLLCLPVLLSLLAFDGPAKAAQNSSAQREKTSCVSWHTVRSNDTLGLIASRYGIEPYRVVNSNNLASPYTIYTGQKLCIPKPAVHAEKLKKLPKKYLNQGAAYFNLAWSPTGLVIKPVNFPVKSSMVVKLDDLGTPAVKWVKAGVFTTRKGVQEYKIRLPRDLKDARQLSVCIKNLNTDLQMCRNSPYR